MRTDNKLEKFQEAKNKNKILKTELPISKKLSISDVIKQNNINYQTQSNFSRKLLSQIKCLQSQNKALKESNFSLKEDNRYLTKINQEYKDYKSSMEDSRNTLEQIKGMNKQVNEYKILVNSLNQQEFHTKVVDQYQGCYNDDRHQDGVSQKVNISQSLQMNSLSKKLRVLELSMLSNILNYQQKIDRLGQQNIELQSKFKYYQRKFKSSNCQLQNLLRTIDVGLIRV